LDDFGVTGVLDLATSTASDAKIRSNEVIIMP
jgi:hypothetical protein